MSKIKRKIYEFTAFFDHNENGGYTVTVPALPGLVTEGKNLEETKKMAEDAVRCYITGLAKTKKPIPEESEMASLRLRVAI